MTLALEVHFPVEFSSSPNQTHLNKLIKVFGINRKLQTGVFDYGWSYTLQDSEPQGPIENP